jgi:hypothetical protein
MADCLQESAIERDAHEEPNCSFAAQIPGRSHPCTERSTNQPSNASHGNYVGFHAAALDQAATRTVLLTDCSCCDGDGLLAVETLMSAVQDICSTVVVLVGTTESSRAHFSHWVRSRASTSWSICSEKDVNERLRVIIERR